MSQTAANANSDHLTLMKKALVELRETKAKLHALERAKTEPIAIVGMGCRLPKGANTPEAFWSLLRDQVDAVTEIPATRWPSERYYDPALEAKGKMYTRCGAFLDDPVDEFDAQFFGISPREAAMMDPQQRLLLEVSWEALENAGIAPDRLRNSRTGVFIGSMCIDYSLLTTQVLEAIDVHTGTGNATSALSGRLAYLLGLQGPTLTLDTACSSSLAALHLACQSLRLGECRLALAGGVNLMLNPVPTIVECRARMLSPQGRCQTFDTQADGYVRGEGCGVVALKRLSDARKDGDRIHALIRSSAVNHNGRSSGLTVPNELAQVDLIRQALDSAGLDPAQISYVEAHGTGTALGDPLELEALGTVFGQQRPSEQPLLVGSVKTNVGHLEGAAGIVGLLKAILALQHEEIPANLHFHQPNPNVDWDALPVKVVCKNQPWPVGERPRIAGVSSFGFSGTNAHVIVEEAPKPEAAQDPVAQRPVHLLALSAKTEPALQDLVERYQQHLQAHSDAELGDICFTANHGRAHFDHRLSVVADSKAALLEKLAAGVAEQEMPGVSHGVVSGSSTGKLAFLFTGQGAQFAGMGRQLYETQPTFRAILEQCDRILRPDLEIPLLEVLYGQREGVQGLLDRTDYTQPALFALEYALAQLWLSWGVEPGALMGHSVGEYVAACIAGVFSLEDGLKLIAARARLMQQLPPTGTMAAVFAPAEPVAAAIAPWNGRVVVGAYNSPSNTVISGEREAVAEVLSQLKGQGIKSRPLKVSGAFHSPLMEPILEEFASVARQIHYNAPSYPIVSNLSGSAIAEELTHPDYWVRHLRESVKFTDGMACLKQLGCDLFLEIGPKPTLLGLGRACLSSEEAFGTWLPSLRPGQADWQVVLESLGVLYCRGVAINWSGYDRDYAYRRVSLPTYPFQRQRYWVEIPTTSQSNGQAANGHHFAREAQSDNGQVTGGQALPTLVQQAKDLLPQLLDALEKLEQPGVAPEEQLPASAQPPSEFLQQLHAAPARDRLALTIAHLQTQVMSVLKLPPSQTPDPELGFFDLGMDSLLAVELKQRLEASLGRTLSPTLAFNYPTIAALAQYILGEVLALDPQPSPAPTVAKDDEKLAQTVAQLETLSDREVEALLLEKLATL